MDIITAAPNESIAMEFKDFSTEQKDTKVKTEQRTLYLIDKLSYICSVAKRE